MKRECLTWVRLDKTHVEHNESALPLIADMKANIDFCRSGPEPDSPSTKPLG